MTPSELKLELNVRGSHFFDRENMKFFGDTMTNYGVRSAVIKTYTGETAICWELYRKRPVKYGLKTSAYFDKRTFEQRFKDNG